MTQALLAQFPNLLTVVAIAAPIYYVVFKRRVIFPFILSWLLIIAAQQFVVSHSDYLYNQGSIEASQIVDTTTVGLTIFSGWVPALLYCFLLVFVRKLCLRVGLIKNQAEQDVAPDGE